MTRTQTLVQLTEELLAELDARRAREGRSRSEVIREAIERYLADGHEAELDRLIQEGYTRQPATELAPDAEWSARQLIEAEPW
jgi:metal-responsive CopG/Arc/MetJ family transcriptional regulator